MADSAQTLVTAAVGQGYMALSWRNLAECLLYAVSNGGGGGGGGGSGGVEQGDGPPVAPPADPLVPAVYTDKLTTFFYFWQVDTQTWVIGSTSGGNPLSQGSGAPVAPPTDPSVPSMYVDIDDNYVIYTWNVGEAAWH
jgi:hypothetical protein